MVSRWAGDGERVGAGGAVFFFGGGEVFLRKGGELEFCQSGASWLRGEGIKEVSSSRVGSRKGVREGGVVFFMNRRPTLYTLQIAVDFLKSL